MFSTVLDARTRVQALERLAGGAELDLLVVGGGVTGAGIALDAATRGLSVAVVEARDWAGATSQWSSKLVHGGLRYLYQFDLPLVAEALKERGLLLERTAPHLVRAQPFLWPLQTPVVERTYSAVGVGMYDVLAQIGAGGRRQLPIQKHFSRTGAKELFPGIRDDALVGAILFYDARVDDARLVVDLVRTAAGYGALALSRAEVVGFATAPGGRVTGATVRDLESGREFGIRARYTIGATGVWTERTQEMAHPGSGLKVLASKGIHIVVPKERIKGDVGLFLRTEKSVLFVIPWERYWVIGTTDTPWREELGHPVATAADVDYVLHHANSVLEDPLNRADVVATYAGLRPLLQPETKDDASSAKVSREHTVAEVAPGMCAIAGGKLTTYRVMAEDAVDFALDHLLGKEAAKHRPSITEDVPLVGAAGYRGLKAQRERLGAEFGWDLPRVKHLLGRYGDEVRVLADMVRAAPDLGAPLAAAPAYLRVEIAFAAERESVVHLEDVMMRRTRLHYEERDRGVGATDEIAALLAPRLGWDAARVAAEIAAYRAAAAADDAAALEPTDADAARARAGARDLAAATEVTAPEPEPGASVSEDQLNQIREAAQGGTAGGPRNARSLGAMASAKLRQQIRNPA